MTLIHGDCLEEMKKLQENSVDLLFCDLPYGATNCAWDCLIDLSQFWKEVNRICKDTTPMFFTCSTRFGVSLINSNPKNFRYDMVWVKSAPCGFLNAKKMPMKKHEMLYVFYRKLPLYDLSSHKHKFLKEPAEEKFQTSLLYGNGGKDTQKKTPRKIKVLGKAEYEPSLPTSILREETEWCKYDVDKNAYGGGKQGRIKISKKKEEHETRYEPALPTSILREETESLYGTEKGKIFIYDENGKLRNSEPRYDPPLPSTVLRETDDQECYSGNITYNYEDRSSPIYDPPLPHSILEIKSEKGKHATQKPTALIEWCLKYFTKEGDIVLDPTMGSGSTGVACKNMNRKFIGIEKDKTIYDIAVARNS